MKKLAIFLILAVLAGGGVWYYQTMFKSSAVVNTYLKAVIEKGDVVQEVTATGTIEPVKEVEVGTQVNGPILHLYVDFNSPVTNGQIIAEIDPAVYEAAFIKAEAQLKSYLANVQDIKVKLEFARKTLDRHRELAKRQMVAQATLDNSISTVGSLEAQLKVAEANVEQGKANADQARTNLGYCTIRSPVDGVVISRDVDEGQTVVSSMSAQKLFVIAETLKTVQVEASVPEADVGMVRVGQVVTFTVDAYRNTFRGRVRQIRMAATTTSNVVTYPVIVEAENPEEKPFPGMTANLSIIVAEAKDAVVIPAAALRFTPPGAVSDVRGRKVWIEEEDGSLKAVAVKVGITDSTRYAMRENSEELLGKEVLVGIARNSDIGASEVKNPFAPSHPKRNQRKINGKPQ